MVPKQEGKPEQKNVLREGLKQYAFSTSELTILTSTSATIEDQVLIGGIPRGMDLSRVGLLKRLNVNEYVQIPIQYGFPASRDEEHYPRNDLKNPQILERYVERLKDDELDIGHGDCEFGYKMPLPSKDEMRLMKRDLIIFRRQGEIKIKKDRR